MTFKEFMYMYSNWNGTTTVNDNNLNPIVTDRTFDIMECVPRLNGVENYDVLFNMKVVSFTFYDGELCVRVK